jgi:hypothetical protein
LIIVVNEGTFKRAKHGLWFSLSGNISPKEFEMIYYETVNHPPEEVAF